MTILVKFSVILIFKQLEDGIHLHSELGKLTMRIDLITSFAEVISVKLVVIDDNNSNPSLDQC